MSQAFLNGFRASRNMGVGDVRTPMMRSLDQAQTQSGNPGLAYNAPRMRPPQQMPPINQMQGDPRMGGFARQQMPQMMGNPQPPQDPQMTGAPSHPLFNGLNQQPRVLTLNPGQPGDISPQEAWAMRNQGIPGRGYRAPVLRGEPVAQVAEMPVQGQVNYRNPSGPMFTNLNAGRYGRNRPMNQ